MKKIFLVENVTVTIVYERILNLSKNCRIILDYYKVKENSSAILTESSFQINNLYTLQIKSIINYNDISIKCNYLIDNCDVLHANDICLHNLIFQNTLHLHGASFLLKDYGIIIVGKSNSGKSSILRKFINKKLNNFNIVSDDQLVIKANKKFLIRSSAWDTIESEYKSIKRLLFYCLSDGNENLPMELLLSQFIIHPIESQLIINNLYNMICKIKCISTFKYLNMKDTQNSVGRISEDLHEIVMQS